MMPVVSNTTKKRTEAQRIVARLKESMTYAEIAAMVGASSRSVENWHYGSREASPVFLRALRTAAMARGVR
jgi:DNA-binding transcriptional regulator YiaG